MRIYRCKQPYFSGLADEPVPHWPWDYHEPEEMVQQGTGEEALQHAFHQCHAVGRDMNPGDAISLADGSLWRCEVEGWKNIGKTWASTVVEMSRKLSGLG